MQRILDLIPAHPEIMRMERPHALFLIPGFHCNDFAPPLAQTYCALGKAQAVYGQSCTAEGVTP